VNELDGIELNKNGFSFRDLIGQDRWTEWTPTYSFATATSLTVVGRFRIIGKQCFFQVHVSGTSMATTAGTSYVDLPIAATGYAGSGMMSNDSTNVVVDTGHIDVATSRFYPPTQLASGDTFTMSGWFEIGA
jgi:hypothetical protein